jgi:adenine phosphoribosyltransferase
VEGLKRYIREIPDWPKSGILFYDITTLLKDPVGMHHAVDALANYYVGRLIDRVVGIEARGFIFAPMVAYRLNAGFVPLTTSNTVRTRWKCIATPLRRERKC